MIPEKLIRKENEGTEEYCFRLMNEYKADPETLRFGYNYTGKDGERYFSKQMTLFQLWHYGFNDRLIEMNNCLTRSQFFEKIQHRTILPCELTFDIDDTKLGQKMSFPSIKSKAQFIKQQLEHNYNYKPVIYFTGHKSYHLTCIIPELLKMDKQERLHFKQDILIKYGCDVLKASESCLIAIELGIHYKSGKPKIEVEI